MEMGMLFFLAGVGLRAGHGLIEGLRTVGLEVFLSGVTVTVLPVVVGYLVGRYVLKFSPVILMGAITGSLTSTPALVIVNKTARSSLPALGYAGAYAFANILLTFAGQIIMLL
jgi:putative transport protein